MGLWHFGDVHWVLSLNYAPQEVVQPIQVLFDRRFCVREKVIIGIVMCPCLRCLCNMRQQRVFLLFRYEGYLSIASQMSPTPMRQKHWHIYPKESARRQDVSIIADDTSKHHIFSKLGVHDCCKFCLVSIQLSLFLRFYHFSRRIKVKAF